MLLLGSVRAIPAVVRDKRESRRGEAEVGKVERVAKKWRVLEEKLKRAEEGGTGAGGVGEGVGEAKKADGEEVADE